MMIILIILSSVFIMIFCIGLNFKDEIVMLISGIILLLITSIGWLLLGNKLSNKTDITYITLKSVKDSTTFNSIVIYKNQTIKDDSYLLFIQDSMTVKEVLSYNMYGTLISSSYIPIIK